MRKTNLTILLILGLSLVLRADSCVTEEKDVQIVFGADFAAVVESSVGWTEANDSDMVSVAADEDLLDAFDELQSSLDGTITSINVNGARFEMLTNEGHDARRTGEVFVSINGGAEVKLLDWNTPNNLPGTEGFAVAGPLAAGDAGVVFDAAGLAAVNLALDTFLANYNDGISPNDLAFDFRATWTSTPAPSASDPDNFTWEAVLLFQMTQDTPIEVPSF